MGMAIGDVKHFRMPSTLLPVAATRHAAAPMACTCAGTICGHARGFAPLAMRPSHGGSKLPLPRLTGAVVLWGFSGYGSLLALLGDQTPTVPWL